jgi:hypothetical protein
MHTTITACSQSRTHLDHPRWISCSNTALCSLRPDSESHLSCSTTSCNQSIACFPYLQSAGVSEGAGKGCCRIGNPAQGPDLLYAGRLGGRPARQCVVIVSADRALCGQCFTELEDRSARIRPQNRANHAMLPDLLLVGGLYVGYNPYREV